MFDTAIFAATAETTGFKTISWTPQQLENGSPCLFRVETDKPLSALTARWQSHTLAFIGNGDHRVWYALAGVDVEASPGNYPLELQATFPDGTSVETSRSVDVRAASYPTETLRVPENYVKPNAKTLRRIAVDKQLKTKAFDHQMNSAWTGDFRVPIASSVSESFGTRRTFNGELASIHRGVDYHAKPGTPVFAANAGEVVLAHNLFYEGNCVILDHGQQFMTLYMHLSRLKVKEGQRVTKGQMIGLSGATGRATGPHLHVAVRWQGAYLDPVLLWQLQLPAAP